LTAALFCQLVDRQDEEQVPRWTRSRSNGPVYSQHKFGTNCILWQICAINKGYGDASHAKGPQCQVQEEEQEEEQEQEQEEEQQQEEEVEREDEEVQERNTIDDREVFETVELM